MRKASETLSRGGLSQCFDEECHLASPKHGRSAKASNPAVHYHLDNEKGTIYETTVRLYLKENRLWEINGFEVDPYFTDGAGRNLIFSSDESLPMGGNPNAGTGRYSEDLPSVRIPTPQRCLEAMVLLLVRDRDTDAANFWVAMMCYMVIYVIIPGRLPFDRLDEDIAQFAKAIMYPGVPYKEALKAAVNALDERARKGLVAM